MLIRTNLVGLALLTGLSFPSVAVAEDRYSMTLKDGAVVRLDQKTGAISFCKTKGASISCTMAADERTAWSSELEVMANRIEMLEKRLSAVEGLAEGAAPVPPKGEKKSSDENKITSNTDTEDRKFDKAMDRAETFMRRMIGVIKELKGATSTN